MNLPEHSWTWLFSNLLKNDQTSSKIDETLQTYEKYHLAALYKKSKYFISFDIILYFFQL